MNNRFNTKCIISCQKGKRFEADFPDETGHFAREGLQLAVKERPTKGGLLGEIELNIENKGADETFNLSMETPVQLALRFEEKPKNITAMHLYNRWWTRPVFAKSFDEIPDHTQIAFFEFEDRAGCLVPMVGEDFITCIASGTEDALYLNMSAHMGGKSRISEPVFLYTEAKTLDEAVHQAFSWLADEKSIKTRQEKRIPEMFEYLGWCSWDAFYKEVSEDKLRTKAKELTEKNIPVRWMLIDDGWQSYNKNDNLTDYQPTPEKFPHGFKEMTKDIKSESMIRWFGVWHALCGYWNGIEKGSPIDLLQHDCLYETISGKLLPNPQNAERFYRDWYKLLRKEGIDFVKVDAQSIAPQFFENSIPAAKAARGQNESLEGGASILDGSVINCMGMAMENILARPNSAISRNSDDFLPLQEESFTEHLLQNAYNALYHNELYCCDWDMFWTTHPHSTKHALLRAISGGPVYFSDKIGETNPEVLKPLAYLDGKLLRMNRSAKPTADCLFTDPRKQGVLKLHNAGIQAKTGLEKNGQSRMSQTNISYQKAERKGQMGGGIALYNLTDQAQDFAFTPEEVPELADYKDFWVYDWFTKKAFSLHKGEKVKGNLEPKEFAWYVLLPKTSKLTNLGLLDKYAGFLAAQKILESDQGTTILLRESGKTGWISDQTPKKVKANHQDVTSQVVQDGNLWILDLPETSQTVVLNVEWE